MEDLPKDIQSKILSYVPDESILECKLVSTTWYTLLSHRKTASGLLLNMYESSFKENVVLRFGYCDEILSHTRIKDLYEKLRGIEVKHPLVDKETIKKTNMVGSCNGLVCLFMQDEAESVVHLFNPFTGEYFDLPITHNTKYDMVMGFGYDPSRGNYKVVKIEYPEGPKNKGLVQICTVGSDSNGWRSIGEIDYTLAYDHGISWNGSTYWLDRKHYKIVAFGFADEEFRCLPTAPSFEHTLDTQLTLLGGYLSIVTSDRDKKRTYLWLFKNKQNAVEEEGYYPSREWILEFKIPFFPDDRISEFKMPFFGDKNDRDHFDRYEPFGLATNNEVFLWYRIYTGMFGFTISTLCRYDPKTDSLIKVLEMGLTAHHGIPHVNSLVSLKALGVDSTTIEFPTLGRMRITEEGE